MKLHFEPDLDYQLQAIEAVCDLFRGQEICRTEFTVTRDPADTQMRLGFAHNDLGIGNRLTLLDDELLANLQAVQLRNGIAPSESLASGDFTVEMETGTGKTYVYLRTIFELNKRYGFTKFVIVVPSIAIKEGVYKSLQIMEDHFRSLYAGVPFDYFLYDSAKLGQVRNFATSAQIQIMVVTVGAINKKDVNNLYKDSEKTGGEKPIDLIKAAAERGRRADGRGQAGAGCHDPPLHPALLRHARGQAPHGLPPRRGGRLRASAGQADRGRVGNGGRRAQQAVRASGVGQQQTRQHQRQGGAGCGDSHRRAAPRGHRVRRRRPGADDPPSHLPRLSHRRDLRCQRK